MCQSVDHRHRKAEPQVAGLCFRKRRPSVLIVKTHTAEAQPDTEEVVFLKYDVFEEMCNARGWHGDSRRAKELGLKSHTTVRRLRVAVELGTADAARPGEKFIGAALATFGVPFETLFGRRGSAELADPVADARERIRREALVRDMRRSH